MTTTSEISQPMTNEEESSIAHSKVCLVYDGDCPICSHYADSLTLTASWGKAQLINGREVSPTRDQLTEKGVDLDQNLVVTIGQRFYLGADALYQLSKISRPSGFGHSVLHMCYSHKLAIKWMYPIFRFTRKLLLRIQGKSLINNLQSMPTSSGNQP
jgi:predicted DCC family thiol-disulfide oxidoreductase YuxK